MSEHSIQITINGNQHATNVEGRLLLSDFLRLNAGYTGVHLGCEHGVCGACTVIVDGKAVRSCLMLAVQADGSSVTTVEGLAAPDGTLHPVQQALRDEHGLQCGFCTPGMIVAAQDLLKRAKENKSVPSRDEIREHLSGNYCRCTGYHAIVDAVEAVARSRAGGQT